MQLQVMSMASTVAFSKRRVPTRRQLFPANPSFSLPKQAQLYCESAQAQFRLSSALRSLVAQAPY
jgi:hypothetical protein